MTKIGVGCKPVNKKRPMTNRAFEDLRGPMVMNRWQATNLNCSDYRAGT